MNNKAFYKIPGTGMRSIKTAVAVMLCMLCIYVIELLLGGIAFFQSMTSFYACTAAVICMQDTVLNTVSSGISRLIGTVVGGGIAFLALLLNWKDAAIIPVVGAGIVLCITVCNILKKSGACGIACIMFLVIILAHNQQDRYSYALLRIFETSLGIVIAVLVNKYFVRPKWLKLPKFWKKDESSGQEDGSHPDNAPDRRRD